MLRAVCECGRWRKKLKECDRHRMTVSFWSCIAFVGLGSSLVVFGPTLLDVASHLSVGVGSLAIMFAIRALGGALGSVGSGFVLDKLEGFSYTTMIGILVASIATTAAVPLSVHIVMLGFVMFFNGMATGSLDNGTHAVLMKMWKDKAGPCMQFLHFAFALGAFFAPLLAKPFLSEEVGDKESSSDPVVSNFSCSERLNELPFTFGNASLSSYNDSRIDTNCTLLLIINSLCSNHTTNYSSGNQLEELLAFSNCSTSTGAAISDQEDSNSLLFAWAYWIAASFFVPPLLAFMYYAIRIELVPRFRKEPSTQTTASPDEDEQVQEEDLEDSKSREGDEKSVPMKQSRCYRFLLLSLLFVFMLFYVGIEVAFGSFIFTVAVKGELQFSKQKAAFLASVFWGTFAFTRLFSVILAVVKTPASWMMTGNITGSVIAATIMLAFPHNAIAIWIGSAVLGVSFASIYPTTMTWFAQNMEVTGKATAVLITGGTLGDIALPAAVGFLVGHVSPDALIYFTFIGIFVSALFLVLLFLTAHIERKRSRVASTANVRYTRLGEDRSENGEINLENNDGNVIGGVEVQSFEGEVNVLGDGDEVKLLDNVTEL